jgi:hypothetical protein
MRSLLKFNHELFLNIIHRFLLIPTCLFYNIIIVLLKSTISHWEKENNRKVIISKMINTSMKKFFIINIESFTSFNEKKTYCFSKNTKNLFSIIINRQHRKIATFLIRPTLIIYWDIVPIFSNESIIWCQEERLLP